MTDLPELWRPMKTAPRDGTIVRLLVDYRGKDACHPLEDAPITHTVGGNTDGNTGLKEGWKFAGWSWEQDCFCEGRGKPVGWLPLAPAACSGNPCVCGKHGIAGVAPTRTPVDRSTEMQPQSVDTSSDLQGAAVERPHCQSAHPNKDVCRASLRDGVVCPGDSCDIDDGIRPPDGGQQP